MSDVTKYLQSIEDRIDNINSCESLEEAAAEIKVELNALLADIQGQINALAPLLVAPSADLGAIVGWINSLIATFTGPYNAYIAELVLVTTKISSITAKLNGKISTLGCSFTPPTIP